MSAPSRRRLPSIFAVAQRLVDLGEYPTVRDACAYLASCRRKKPTVKSVPAAPVLRRLPYAD